MRARSNGEVLIRTEAYKVDPFLTSPLIESLMLRTDLAYFAEEILGMEVVDHHKEWSALAAKYKRLGIEAPRDHGKSYFFSFAYAIWRAYHHWIPDTLYVGFKSIPKISLGYIFSNTQPQSIALLQIVKHEIESNPKLQHLIPAKRENWSKMEIKLSNGSIIRARGWGVSVRGAHPVWAVCQPKGTEVLTRRGYKKIESLRLGDEVWTHRGRWKPITNIGLRRSEVVGYKISGNDDYEWATPEHKFYGDGGFYVPGVNDWVKAPIQSDEADLPLSASIMKLLGLFLGDGTLYNARNGNYRKTGIIIYVSRHESEIDTIIKEAGFHPNWSDGVTCRRVTINNESLYRLCKTLKRKGNSQKRVPFRFESLPKDKLKALVYGYYLSDGCFTHSKNRSGEYKFSSVSRPMLRSFQRVLTRLGVTSNIRVLRESKWMDVCGRKCLCQKTYDLRVGWEFGTLFGFEYKPSRTTKNKRQYISDGFIRRKVEKIVRPSGEVDVVSFTVDEDHSYSGHLVCTHNCDDVLNDETIYSELTRTKQIEYFFGAVTPMVVPGGQIVVIGCVNPETFVLTKNGVAKIGSLIPDNKNFSEQRILDFNKDVYGENGFHRADKFWVNGKCLTKKITTTYGLELEGSYQHPIRVAKGKSPLLRKLSKWERMDKLKVGGKVRVEIGQNAYGDKFDDVDFAYFMGLWTAEGSSESTGRITICTSEKTLLAYLDSKPMGLKFSRHQNKSRIQSVALYKKMSEHGVVFKKAESKVIPVCIFSATKAAQSAFIKGFADGDGCSYINQRIQQINLSSASKDLIFGLRALLMNMGMLPSYMIKPPGVSKLVTGKFNSHQLTLSAGYAYKFMQDIGFTVAHKIKTFRASDAPQKRFVGIKKIENSECETVDFVIPRDHTFCSNGFISHNTPFHKEDLYQRLAENKLYYFKRYPALDQLDRALWPTRYTKAHLMGKKEEVGSTRFAREYLCLPISDESSLFPEKILTDCYDHQHELPNHLTPEDHKHLAVFTGVDLALSATVGADYTVITTLGIDKHRNRWILDIRRKRGLSMTEQLREIEDVHRNFKPLKILIEDNGFQRVFRDELVKNTDLPVEGFTTTATNKNSLDRGIPSLQILFENRKFIIPRKTERDRRITDQLTNELKCFTWANGKLQGLGSHDDMVLSLWIASEACNSYQFSFSFIGE